MSNTITYQVKLTPLSSFFFGNEQGETADYYLKGNNFPQQTALLGLIRHQLLIQNNLIGSDQKITSNDNAKKLIGDSSFSFNEHNSFGVINSVSPCFILNLHGNKYQPTLPFFAASIGKAGENYFFPNFDPKIYSSLNFISENGDQKSEDDFFYAEERPGIDKPYDGITKEKAYFKQVWVKLKKGYSFGFYVTIDKTRYPEGVNFTDAFVTFGKESMPFKMEVAEQAITIQQSDRDTNAVVLLSDTYIGDADIISKCELAVTDTVSFRNILNKTSQDKKDYFNKIPREGNSIRLQLLKKGSLLFSTNKLTEISEAIDKHTNFKTIGYNHYKQIKLTILP
jgi:CRISPR-associated protein Cmr3